jgi:gas vesicle protein
MGHRHSVTEDPLKVMGIAALAATVGATVAMLFTPRSGEQVRGGLKRRAANLKGKAVKTVDDTQEVNENVKERLQTTASKIADDMKSTTQKVKDDVKDTKEDEAKAAKRTADRARTKDQ